MCQFIYAEKRRRRENRVEFSSFLSCPKAVFFFHHSGPDLPELLFISTAKSCAYFREGRTPPPNSFPRQFICRDDSVLFCLLLSLFTSVLDKTIQMYSSSQCICIGTLISMTTVADSIILL